MSEDFPVVWEDPGDVELSWEWAEEASPAVFPPLSADAVRVFYEGFNERYRRTGVPFRTECRIINGYLYSALRPLVPAGELPTAQARAWEMRRAETRKVLRFWHETALPKVLDICAWLRNAPLETVPLADLAKIWNELWSRLPELGTLHAAITTGAFDALTELSDLYQSLVEDAPPSGGLKLVQGLPHELHTVQRDLYLLAERARASAPVAEAIIRDPRRAIGELPALEAGGEFSAALRSFLETHGHLGHDDLTAPSWSDDPSVVFDEIRKRLLSEPEDPDAHRLRLAVEAEVLADQVRTHLTSRPGAAQRFEEALSLARDVAPLTQTHNYWLDRMGHSHLHRFMMRLARRLVDAGVFDDVRDVFFLHRPEVTAVLETPCDLRPMVRERRHAHQLWASIRPPRFLGRRPEPLSLGESVTLVQSPVQILRGVPASPGVVQGPARVVLGPEDFCRVQRGDILVTATSHPSWVPLFGLIRGMVTNAGGVLSHSAVLAREFGVPAVVGAEGATQRIHNGQLIEVDGNSGEVHLGAPIVGHLSAAPTSTEERAPL